MFCRYLILIESGIDNNFRALIDARDYILNAGWTLRVEKLVRQLEHTHTLNVEIERALGDKKLTEYERYQMIKSMV